MSHGGEPSKKSFLVQIQREAQDLWAKLELNNVDSQPEKEKFMVTLPPFYAAHDMSMREGVYIAKADFLARYQTMLGKQVLFPYYFQGSGKYIKTCCEQLEMELQQFGCPPVFPEESSKGLQSPIVKRMWNELAYIGDVSRLTNPQAWFEHFTSSTKDIMTSFGALVDWRRSFINTDVNPYYESFVRWQLDKLKAQGRIKLGEQHVIWSPLSKRVCDGHDRSTGECAIPEQRTLIKLPIVPSAHRCPLSPLFFGKYNLFMVTSIYYTELIYGITNLWVSPPLSYGAYLVNDTDVFVCTPQAALRLSLKPETPECLAKFTGSDLLGLLCLLPFSSRYIFVLPMSNNFPEMGTGVIGSVPSYIPADYIMLQNLQQNEALREKLVVNENWVLHLAPIPVMRVGAGDDVLGSSLCKKFHITSIDETQKLKRATGELYKSENPSIIAGPCINKSAFEGRKFTTSEILRSGNGVVYFELSDKVISKQHGDECVIAKIDHWVILYNDSEWGAQVMQSAARHLERLLVSKEDCQCTVTSGIGSHPSWDPTQLINPSLEFPLAPAYSTISHLLQGGILGKAAGPLEISADQLIDTVWDYIFLGTAYPSDCSIPEEKLFRLRQEYLYWYPLDIYIYHRGAFPPSFILFNHVAVFPQELWPKELYLTSNNTISSSFGSLKSEIRDNSADATRLALAEAGDSETNFIYSSASVNAGLLKLYNYVTFAMGVAAMSANKSERGYTFHDKVLESAINLSIQRAREAYDNRNYRAVVQHALYQMLAARENYKRACDILRIPPIRSLLVRFVEITALLLAPVTPHTCEHVWGLLKNSGSVTRQPFPNPGKIYEDIDFLQRVLYTEIPHQRYFDGYDYQSGVKNQALCLHVNCPAWHTRVTSLLSNLTKESSSVRIDDLLNHFAMHLPTIERSSLLLPSRSSKYIITHEDAIAGKNRPSPTDILAFLRENLEYIKGNVRAQVVVRAADLPNAAPGEIFWGITLVIVEDQDTNVGTTGSL